MIDKIQAEQDISKYLADETQLYQDWYQTFYVPEGDTDTVPFTSSFSLATLKKRFNDWFEKRREMLREQICQKWQYSSKKSQFKNQQDIIIALSIDCLAIALSLPTTNVVTVATILVVDGYLEKLCPNSCQK